MGQSRSEEATSGDDWNCGFWEQSGEVSRHFDDVQHGEFQSDVRKMHKKHKKENLDPVGNTQGTLVSLTQAGPPERRRRTRDSRRTDAAERSSKRRWLSRRLQIDGWMETGDSEGEWYLGTLGFELEMGRFSLCPAECRVSFPNHEKEIEDT